MTHLHKFLKVSGKETEACVQCGKEREARLKVKIRKPLNPYGQSDIAEEKRLVQANIREWAIKKFGECVMKGKEGMGECDHVLQADHQISRAVVGLYAETRNILLVCRRHHSFKQFPRTKPIYERHAREIVGEETLNWLEEKAKEKKE